MESIEAITLNQMLKIQLKFNNKVIKISQFNHMSAVFCLYMSELKILKKEHKKLEVVTKKTTKKRLNDRASDSWKDLRKLKKLKLQLKDRINQLEH